MEGDNATSFNHLSGRIYRRKRRHQGATWTPESTSALKEDGLWCGVCKQRHGYMKMGLTYEKASDGSSFKLLWSCPKTGNVLT